MREAVIFENLGQRLFGVFHKPVGVISAPTVVVCHGLGGNKTGRYRIYVHLAEQLAKHGIATLRFDFRGAGDSEGEFSDMTVESQVSDAKRALNYLHSRDDVDLTRIGLMGCSFGGAIAVLAAQQVPLKSIALWAPLFTSDQWLEKWKALHADETDKDTKNELMRIEGQIAGYPFLQQLFSLDIATALKTLDHIPLLHIHGKKDEVVNFSQSSLFKQERHKAKAESKFISLENSDHDFSYDGEQKRMLHETAKWFERTL